MKVTEHLAKAKKTHFSIEILPPLKGSNYLYALQADEANYKGQDFIIIKR